MRLTDMLALSHVPRWVTVDTTKPQTVADHSFRVVVIFIELMTRLDLISLITPIDLMCVLYHDGAEARTGDIPGPIKRKYLKDGTRAAEDGMNWSVPKSDRRAINALLKLADLIEAYTFLERYGIRRHTEMIAMDIYAEITDSTYKDAAESIIDDILSDAGRFECTAGYPFADPPVRT